jgi:precorrin-2/cobalt-factor-2 C20-methyltransferase
MSGRLLVIGVGPGDPELLTLKAVRLLASCGTVVHFAKRGHAGHASRIAGAHIPPGVERLRLEYPYTTEVSAGDPAYIAAMAGFYDLAAADLARRLDAGGVVGLLCEGDPFFYGSAMHVFARLRDYACEVVPGVTGMSGAWSAAALPMTQGHDSLAVLSGTLPEAVLAARLEAHPAAVIMKIGRNLAKIRRALAAVGREQAAVYVERATMAGQIVLPLREVDAPAPYFSLILVPGWQDRC